MLHPRSRTGVRGPGLDPARWAGSSVTAGPRGRIAATVALLAVGPLIVRFFPLGGWVLLLLWVVVLPWALRDVWREVRVRR